MIAIPRGIRATGERGRTMRLTAKGRYAVAAMLDLALHGQERAVALTDVAVRQEIPASYLAQLFTRLRRCGLVASRRGPGGGYRLAKSSEDISVADVIGAVDESVDSTRCGGKADCQSNQRCLTHGLWEGLSRRIYDFLSDTSLAQVLAEREAAKVAKRQDQWFARQHGAPLHWRGESLSGRAQS